MDKELEQQLREIKESIKQVQGQIGMLSSDISKHFQTLNDRLDAKIEGATKKILEEIAKKK